MRRVELLAMEEIAELQMGAMHLLFGKGSSSGLGLLGRLRGDSIVTVASFIFCIAMKCPSPAASLVLRWIF